MNRFKDADPKDTVARIKGILASLDIDVEEFPGCYEGRFFSVRLTDKKTGASTNGKGASENLALASAYGEYIERLQNGFLTARVDCSEEDDGYAGFRNFPDEELVDFDTALHANAYVEEDTLLAYTWREPKGCADLAAAKREASRNFWRKRVGDVCSLVPYYSVATRKVVKLPEDLIFSVCSSNGMASGNTPEEALCEGMSELCERYVKKVVREQDRCLPEIPRSYIEENLPEQAQMMRLIEEKTPNLKLIPLDASLGQGLPVVCMAFVNQAKGSVRIKFGAHPMMAIGLERCMTEHYQGYGVKGAYDWDLLFTPWDSWNRVDTAKFVLDSPIAYSDQGAAWHRLFLSTPDWEFMPWGNSADYDNKQGAAHLTAVLRNIGGDVFVRDTGFLGVCSYRIYVPKVSYAGFLLGDVVSRYAPVQNKISLPVACAACAYDEGDYALAATFLKMEEGGKRRYACAAQELLCRAEGMPEADRDRLLEVYFGENAANYAKNVWRSDDVVEALKEDWKKLQWLLFFGKKKQQPAGASEKREARSALYRKLKDKKLANPLDQSRLRPIFE